MSDTKVYTRTTCARCRKVDEREGAEGDTPPFRWSMVRITRRDTGPGWTYSTSLVDGHFCPTCAADIAATASPTNAPEGT